MAFSVLVEVLNLRVRAKVDACQPTRGVYAREKIGAAARGQREVSAPV